MSDTHWYDMMPCSNYCFNISSQFLNKLITTQLIISSHPQIIPKSNLWKYKNEFYDSIFLVSSIDRLGINFINLNFVFLFFNCFPFLFIGSRLLLNILFFSCMCWKSKMNLSLFSKKKKIKKHKLKQLITQ